MKVSKKGIYALRVLRHLADSYRIKPLPVSYLARTEDISPKYLEQILLILRKNGILVSERGKQGGYSLRMAPDKITLGNIIRAVDGPLAPIPCASRTVPHYDNDCPYPPETCWLRKIMLRVRDNIAEVMDQETLQQMAGEARNSEPNRH